ncbi:phytanoyl-CoA dioxygenase family protein [Flexibacterium corallicola]|uniref:phytanoyl-CoA dioxygenase family protein n=1 Tax=Flexibacterium corallicola TaxID=3037259 RepID=UPI00286F9169|nr:phytanoyl-CoA dioxygenase family protein [Pseudovibrio sp. M1P-2-3]
MVPLDYLKTPLWALEVAGPAKSFKKNPIIGNERLNRWGLHRARLKLAAGLAESRRRRLAKYLTPDQVSDIDQNGFIKIENYLSPADFKALRNEIYRSPMKTRQMRQGQTATRMTPITQQVIEQRPTLKSSIENKGLLNLIRYTAACGGQPIFFIQTVLVDPAQGGADPQTKLHADTFHSTAKAWLFLHDVNEEEGPFSYAPGSHRINDKRLEWEYQNSINACRDKRNHHAHGSFRATHKELDQMGYSAAQSFPVKANTLVIADTFGFHGRVPSPQPTKRIELHAHMRRNPFLPWCGFDLKSLPGVKGRELELFLAYSDFLEKNFGKRTIWRNTGKRYVNSPAVF